LSDLDSGKAVYVFEMPNISFASGGDPYLQDYVAFVAKSKTLNRACYVMECKGGIAQDVIMTIGQAFELRFKEYLRKRPVARPPPISMIPTTVQDSRRPDEVEYYNDLPGKTPPEFSPVQKSRNHKESVGSNLIDFNSDLPSSQHSRHPSQHFQQEPEYVNGDIPNPRKSSNRDPFDMSPFATNPPTNIPDVIKAQLEQEEWYHGAVSREAAERLLQNNGEFLVRDSGNTPGQYVLSGMQNNSKKHLLLVDPNGIVRTKDRTFDSVSHLINYHRESTLPIISAESALRLITPIKRGF
jgi:SHC-transforming protein 1